MGVFIHLAISTSVTKEEWQDVYQEATQLMETFPLAEQRKVPIRGIPTHCLVRTMERDEEYGWPRKKIRTGWFADGDYESMRTAEDFFLPRDLVDEESYEPDAPDAMMTVAPSCMVGYKWDDPEYNHRYHVWGAKTQREPYHMYLLSIACLIESRLGPKAYVYGNITKGQCEKAVSMANERLEKEIHVPDNCAPDRLFERVKTLPLDEYYRLKMYVSQYRGNKDTAFGKSIRDHFSEEACNEYWKKRFEHCSFSHPVFHSAFADYFLWGFDLEKLCGFVQFRDEDGKEHYDEFVQMVLDAKLHQKDANCQDILKIDPDSEQPYGVGTQFAQVLFGGARNRKIERYIPIDEIRDALTHSIGSHCQVEKIIEKYLEEDKEKQKLSGDRLEQSEDPDGEMKRLIQEYEKTRNKYDIPDASYLPYYAAGFTMPQGLKESVGRSFAFYRETLKEKTYLDLMEKSPEDRCRWLADHNRELLIRDTDWEKIYDDIYAHKESFSKYYPMARVEVSGNRLLGMLRAFVLNDELYAYAFELEKQFGNTKD